jgi:hypothetical protein
MKLVISVAVFLPLKPLAATPQPPTPLNNFEYRSGGKTFRFFCLLEHNFNNLSRIYKQSLWIQASRLDEWGNFEATEVKSNDISFQVCSPLLPPPSGLGGDDE